MIDRAREDSVNWAKNLLADPASFVILDTETTGFSGIDEVVQIGVINGNGTVLVDNQLIKPACPWSFEAQEIHRISEDMVATAPSFKEFLDTLQRVIMDRKVIIYNASFDTRLIDQSLHGEPWYFNSECAMLQYARYYGDWNPKRGNFRWQKLPNGDHSAVGDCQAVLKLIRLMAGVDIQN